LSRRSSAETGSEAHDSTPTDSVGQLPARVVPYGQGGRHWLRQIARGLVLAAADCASLFSAAALAYFLWAAPVREQQAAHYLGLWPLLGLALLVYWQSGLYPGFGLGGVEILRRLSISTSIVFLFLLGLEFVFKVPQTYYSRVTAALSWIFALLFVPLGRFVMLAIVRKQRWWASPCIILGSGVTAKDVIRSLQNALTIGYSPIAVLSRQAGEGPESVAGVPIVGGAEDAEDFAAHGVRVAILVDEAEHAWSARRLAWLQSMFRSVLWIHRSHDVPVEGVRVKNLGGIVGVEYANQLLLTRNLFLKRALDLVVGGILAVCTLPLLLLGALAVKLSSRGPAFFSQEREGQGGRTIRVWKLRTMHVDAEERLERVLATDEALREAWEERFKLDPDPRIVPGVGVFLRRFSLDELPQLWQVLTGTLSLVGPRPFPAYHLEHYDPVVLALRRQVRPGVTGLWQVKVRSEGGIELQRSHDAYYIRNWSIWMDLYVLGRTIAAVVLGRGAM
jgi:Undecaprenyl-phosphate galactose phosphotransferase WbaP